jgi:G-patch domain
MAASGASWGRDVYQGIEKSSAAYKMLASMGWQEGDGLVRFLQVPVRAAQAGRPVVASSYAQPSSHGIL